MPITDEQEFGVHLPTPLYDTYFAKKVFSPSLDHSAVALLIQNPVFCNEVKEFRPSYYY
jgi:hypothetical protein